MNIIAFRQPGEKTFKIYQAGEACEIDFNVSDDHFIIHPFLPNETGKMFRLNKQISTFPIESLAENDTHLIFNEIDKTEYITTIEKAINSLKGNDKNKVVIARKKRIYGQTDPMILFETLCTNYPQAFIFLFSVKGFGNWIGATPELLLKGSFSEIGTMALAGTRPAHSNAFEWDDKNVIEHQIVVDYIASTFKFHGFEPDIGNLETISAGPVEHLMTPVKTTLTHSAAIHQLLDDLAPTPALCGMPKANALKTIASLEGERALYGGYCGLIGKDGNFSLSVILRCAYLSENSVTLFAGGGITKQSVPEDEWIETERKMQTLLQFIVA